MSFRKNEQKRLRERYGSWALVTGASSGIGKEIARQLAEAGLNLILVARRQALLEEFAEEIRKKHHSKIQIIPVDLSDETAVQDIIAETKMLDIGMLVAAAGYGTSGEFRHATLTEEREMLKVNCAALLMMTHHFSRVFSEQRRGGIILLSSIVSFQGVPFSANYAATKAYVQSLAEALAIELRPHGVDVLAAAPGPVNSGFAQRANMQMGNVLKPEDVAGPILKSLGRKSTALPGLLTKVLTGSLKTLPRRGRVRIMQLVMGSMTAHQRV